jgi:hypothetical protein
MNSTNYVFKKSENIVSRVIGDEVILVPIRQNSGDLDNIYTLNDVAADIWQRVNGKNTLEDIKNQIAEEYEVAEEQAEKDIIELCTQLESIQAVNRE